MGFDANYLPLWVNILNYCILALTIIVIPLSSLYDGPAEEKKRVLIDLIPNVIGLYLVGLIDMIIGFAGLFKCGNQKVWKKTAHKITAMDDNMIQSENQ